MKKLNIALIGYGKMGKEIELKAIERGHKIGLIIDHNNANDINPEKLKNIDVCIEFTNSKNVVANIEKCFENNIPIVSGTTGWLNDFDKVLKICAEKNASFFYASNFSIGVNIFFDINKRLASLFETYPMYAPEMVEIHHIQKLDAPSGTAITLANDIIASNSRYKKYTAAEPESDEIHVQSIRESNVPGTHTVTWNSDIDKIAITHEAKSRRGFALGAVMAASWIHGRKGVFTMKDMLNL